MSPKSDAPSQDEQPKRVDQLDPKSAGLEGAADEEAGVLREERVEGGDELSIGGGPPSAAGGTRDSPAPTREDLREG